MQQDKITDRAIDAKMRNGVAALVVLSVIGWGLVLWSMANMSSPVVSLMMPMDWHWAFTQIIAVWLMWAVMMGAMMLPSAIPMMSIHRRIAAKRDPENTQRQSLVPGCVSPDLVRVQRRCGGSAMELPACRHLVTYAENSRGIRRRRNPHCSGHLSIDPYKGRVPFQMPNANGFFANGLAPRVRRGVSNGPQAWSVLYRLLLGPHDGLVRRRCHEFDHHRCLVRDRCNRKTLAPR